MTTTTIDQGKLIRAKLRGDCTVCGEVILPGQWIYFRRDIDSRHQPCVERGGDAAAPDPAAAPRDEPRDARAVRDGGEGAADDARRDARGATREAAAAGAATYSFARADQAGVSHRAGPPAGRAAEQLPLLNRAAEACEPAAAGLAATFRDQQVADLIDRLIPLLKLMREQLPARG